MSEQNDCPNAFMDCFERLDNGEWRSPIFAQILIREAQRLGGSPSMLEIGCGLGFDGERALQRQVLAISSRAIGVEPDQHVEPQSVFTEIHRCTLEQASIKPNSIDLAYSVMVMEHVPDPQAFLEAVHRVLRPDGVYWGFTVDRRHWFSRASAVASRLGLKTSYLRWLNGNAGDGGYLDYPTHYRLNSPAAFHPGRQWFRSVYTRTYGPAGAVANYVPRPARGLLTLFERCRLQLGGQRTGFLVRLQK